MLEINKIKVKFKDQIIINNLSLKVKESKIFGILGKNGAGKTTLFESIYQTLKYEGIITYNKKKIQRKYISYLETESYFYPFITGKEYLKYFYTSDQIKSFINIFNLPLDRYIDSYSTGMKKKISFIATLALDKPIIILDEPFNGVDFEGVNMFYNLINDLRLNNKIVMISSHIIETLFHTCDLIGILERGKIKNLYNKDDFEKLKEFKF